MTKAQFVQTIKDLQEQSWGIFEYLVDQIEVDGEKSDKIEITEEDYDSMMSDFSTLLEERFKVK